MLINVERTVRVASARGAVRLLLHVVLLTAGGLSAGCSQYGNDPRSVHVRGEVTFDGVPVPRGGVTFDPDGSQGNSGPQGFAEILDGKYDTKSNGRGTTGGPQIVTITGYDGIPTDDNLEGVAIFSGWRTTANFGESTSETMNFDVLADSQPAGKRPR